MTNIEQRIKDFNKGKITSSTDIIKLFSTLVKTGRIKTLPKGLKRIAQDFIREGIIDTKVKDIKNDLRGANLKGANLTGANLRGADASLN